MNQRERECIDYCPKRTAIRKAKHENFDKKMVEHIGLEPMTPTLPVWCSSQLS